MKLTITRYALRSMKRDAEQSTSRETGGILVGTRCLDKNVIYVAFANGSGNRAHRTASSYETDVNHQQEFLDRVTGRFPQLSYVGSWHKHPGSMNRPSSRDKRTAEELLNNSNYKVDGHLVMPILTVDDDEAKFHPYHFGENKSQFESMEMKTLAIADRETLMDRLEQWRDWEQSQRRLEPTGVKDPFDEDFCWFETKKGKRRLKNEKKKLRDNGFVSELQLKESDGTRFLRITIRPEGEGGPLICEFPRLFPLTKPRIFDGDARKKNEIVDFELLSNGWSDQIYLYELAEEWFRTPPKDHQTNREVTQESQKALDNGSYSEYSYESS